MQEQFANNAVSTIANAGGISSADTTVTVADASRFPTVGQFRLGIDDEILLVVGVSGQMFTVQRGMENTAAAAHAFGAAAALILTAGGLATMLTQAVGAGTPANVQVVGVVGPTGAQGVQGPQGVQGNTGATGPVGPSQGPTINVPALASLTQVGTDPWTLTSTSLGIDMRATDGAALNSNQWWSMPISKTANKFTVVCCVRILSIQAVQQFTLGLTDVGGTAWGWRSTFYLAPTGNPATWQVGIRQSTAGSTTLATLPRRSTETPFPHDRVFMRIQSDGVNRTYSWGIDGVNWIQLYSEAWNLSFVPGAAYIGFYAAGLTVSPIAAIEQFYATAP